MSPGDYCDVDPRDEQSFAALAEAIAHARACILLSFGVAGPGPARSSDTLKAAIVVIRMASRLAPVDRAIGQSLAFGGSDDCAGGGALTSGADERRVSVSDREPQDAAAAPGAHFLLV